MPYRHDQYLKDLIGDCHRTPEGFSMLLFHARTAQERRLEWKHPQSEIELCEHTHETTESALRAARRLLAVSDWKGPLRVTSTLSEEAFWKFCESQQGDPAYRGLEVGASWSGRVCIVAAKEMTIDGRRIRLQMAHEIVPGGPKTKEKDPVGIANLWAGARPERGLRPIHFTDDAIRVEELEVAARWKEGNERSGLPARSSASVFGSAACAHARSRWLSDTQEAWLRCDDCFDGAVARVPMHQVPEDHDAHRPIHPDMSYLSERNFWNAVNDLPNDSGVDLAALRARDGIASMDPADYATPEQEHLFAVRPGLGVSSVSAAMNRR